MNLPNPDERSRAWSRILERLIVSHSAHTFAEAATRPLYLPPRALSELDGAVAPRSIIEQHAGPIDRKSTAVFAVRSNTGRIVGLAAVPAIGAILPFANSEPGLVFEQHQAARPGPIIASPDVHLAMLLAWLMRPGVGLTGDPPSTYDLAQLAAGREVVLAAGLGPITGERLTELGRRLAVDLGSRVRVAAAPKFYSSIGYAARIMGEDEELRRFAGDQLTAEILQAAA